MLGCLPLLMLSCSKEPVKEPVTVSFGVEVSVTDSYASVVVTPSDVEVPYYCDVFTADEYEAAGGTAADAGNSIVGKYISGEIGDGDLAAGKNTFDFKDLEAASDYVAVCVGIVGGEAIETAEANEFRTKEKAEQPEDPDDPDEPEEPEYDVYPRADGE